MEQKLLTGWETRFAKYVGERADDGDGSHDLGHFRRVWKGARYINFEEGGPADELVLLAAAYFHDLVSLPKDDPRRKEASLLCAEKTAGLLREEFADFPAEKIEDVRHAIHAHSFSASVVPLTAEAKILQDADRLEALGAIGLARVFYTAGRCSGRLFDARDPFANDREPDDKRFALDHFQLKLLRLPAMMNTPTGRRLAEKNADYLRGFLRKIGEEIAGEY